MNASIRSWLSSGIAAASVGAFVVVPAAPEHAPARTRQPAVALAAQVQPLVAVAPVPSPQQVAGLLNQQVAFHVNLAVDFVVTGAQLVDRQLPVPGILLSEIQNGTPLPAAVGRALRTLAEIEVDAGRELVGFAAQYVDFQIRFVANALQTAVVVATAIPAAVGGLVASTVAGLVPAATPSPAATSDVTTARKADIDDTSSSEAGTKSSTKSNLANASTSARDREVDSEVSTDTTDVDDAKSSDTDEVTDDHPSRAGVSEESSSPSANNAKHADEPGGQQANPNDDRDADDTTGDESGD